MEEDEELKAEMEEAVKNTLFNKFVGKVNLDNEI